MSKLYNTFDSVVSFCGISVSLQNIESALSIILLIISIANLVIKFAFSIYNKLKDGKLTGEELQELTKDFEELTSNIKQLTNNESEDDNNGD